MRHRPGRIRSVQRPRAQIGTEDLGAFLSCLLLRRHGRPRENRDVRHNTLLNDPGVSQSRVFGDVREREVRLMSLGLAHNVIDARSSPPPRLETTLSGPRQPYCSARRTQCSPSRSLTLPAMSVTGISLRCTSRADVIIAMTLPGGQMHQLWP